MKTNSHNIIQHTKHFWSGRTGAQLSADDAREIVANVTGFFQVLCEWDKKAHEVNDADLAHVSRGGIGRPGSGPRA